MDIMYWLEWEETFRFLGNKVINFEDFSHLIFRFAINCFVCYLVVGRIYKNQIRKSEFTFTYYSLSVLVFMLCYLLGGVKLELGFALGLFAIFGIIRYRTSLISIKDMTYLFVIIGLSVINALSNQKVSWVELIFANGAILCIMFLREGLTRNKTKDIELIYDNVNLIQSDKKEELYADLSTRLGVDVVNVKLGKINYIKDAVEMVVFYKENKTNET